MTEANRSIAELPGLLEERRKFEGWLAALHARTDAPRHVFERVKADYETRLRRVQEELSAHRHMIEEERASLSSRRSLVEADEQLRRDERTELELRLHVGEIAGEEADTAFSAVDEALEHLVAERDDLAKRISDLELLLETKSAEPAAVEAEPVPEVTVHAASANASQIESEPASTEEHSPALAVTAEHAVGAPESVAAADSHQPVQAAQSVESEQAVPTEAEREPGGDHPLRSRDPRHTPGGSFDELAFLSTLVGDGAPASGNGAADPAESLLAGLGEQSTRRPEERPLARNIPGHTPIVLRTTGTAESVKTLKCTECGALNYPTEWYCERCGAELAAL